MREVARELLTLPSEEVAVGLKAAQAWQAGATDFADRTQQTALAARRVPKKAVSGVLIWAIVAGKSAVETKVSV